MSTGSGAPRRRLPLAGEAPRPRPMAPLGRASVLVEGSGAAVFADAFEEAWRDAAGTSLARFTVTDAEPPQAVAALVAALEGRPALVVASASTGLRAGLHVSVGPEVVTLLPGVHVTMRSPRPGVARALASAWLPTLLALR